VCNDHFGAIHLNESGMSSGPQSGLRLGVDRGIVGACPRRQQISALNYCRMERASADMRHGFGRNGESLDS
jgi:hypothetical protein